MNRQISISDAEWTIMKALWQSEDKKMTLKEIAEAVADSGWSYTTVRTMVGRLVEKELKPTRATRVISATVRRLARKPAAKRK